MCVCLSVNLNQFQQNLDFSYQQKSYFKDLKNWSRGPGQLLGKIPFYTISSEDMHARPWFLVPLESPWPAERHRLYKLFSKAAPQGRIIKSAKTANFRTPRRRHFSENLFNPKLHGILDLVNKVVSDSNFGPIRPNYRIGQNGPFQISWRRHISENFFYPKLFGILG